MENLDDLKRTAKQYSEECIYEALFNTFEIFSKKQCPDINEQTLDKLVKEISTIIIELTLKNL